MKLLAISGSARKSSTNTALLRAISAIAPGEFSIDVFDGVGHLPIFSPDFEVTHLPLNVGTLTQQISACDGLIISSPEYIRGIPGGLKNAIDWLVSREQVAAKPIALVHASHRGGDMLADLRRILSTISSNFTEDLFLQIPVMNETPEAIADIVKSPGNREQTLCFLCDFAAFCKHQNALECSGLPS